jgi:hypothetical protein
VIVILHFSNSISDYSSPPRPRYCSHRCNCATCSVMHASGLWRGETLPGYHIASHLYHLSRGPCSRQFARRQRPASSAAAAVGRQSRRRRLMTVARQGRPSGRRLRRGRCRKRRRARRAGRGPGGRRRRRPSFSTRSPPPAHQESTSGGGVGLRTPFAGRQRRFLLPLLLRRGRRLRRVCAVIRGCVRGSESGGCASGDFLPPSTTPSPAEGIAALASASPLPSPLPSSSPRPRGRRGGRLRRCSEPSARVAGVFEQLPHAERPVFEIVQQRTGLCGHLIFPHLE